MVPTTWLIDQTIKCYLTWWSHPPDFSGQEIASWYFFQTYFLPHIFHPLGTKTGSDKQEQIQLNNCCPFGSIPKVQTPITQWQSLSYLGFSWTAKSLTYRLGRQWAKDNQPSVTPGFYLGNGYLPLRILQYAFATSKEPKEALGSHQRSQATLPKLNCSNRHIPRLSHLYISQPQ